MRIAVFAPDTPFPAHRGGRADVWRRILAWHALGHQVFLVNLFEPAGPSAPRPQDLAAIDRVVQGRFSFPIRRSPWRAMKQLALAWLTPRHAATRVPTPAERAELERRLAAFAPDLLWLEGPWFGRVVLALAARWPYAYRSHNVEHEYLKRQAQAASRWRDRLAWRLACIGLHRFQRRLMAGAVAVFDISMDDLAWWQARGIGQLHWLPPLPQAAVEPSSEAPVPGEVVFVGNLGTPNNVRGVEFLAGEVLPRLRQRRAGATLAIVGSNPAPALRERLARLPGVQLHVDVADPARHLRGARVLVNPVMTGSGVQVKTLDMLMNDAPIVSTRQGVRGLPPEVQALFTLAEGAEAFAVAIDAALDAPLDAQQLAQRAALRERHFTAAAVGHALDVVVAARREPAR